MWGRWSGLVVHFDNRDTIISMLNKFRIKVWHVGGVWMLDCADLDVQGWGYTKEDAILNLRLKMREALDRLIPFMASSVPLEEFADVTYM